MEETARASTKSVAPRRPVVVIGGGPAGLLSALAVAEAGAGVVLVGPVQRHPDAARTGHDGRTTALFEPGLEVLDRLGIGAGLRQATAPIAAIEMADKVSVLFRAPTITFHARDIGADWLGRNVPLSVLTDLLETRLKSVGLIERIEASVLAVTPRPEAILLELSDGRTLTAELVVAADGRRSLAREAAGIKPQFWRYGQSVITAWIGHTLPHRDMSFEQHRGGGPLTTVPLPDDAGGPASALVWAEHTARAEALAALDDNAFARALEEAWGGELGSVRDVDDRRLMPLEGLMVSSLGQRRVALVGETSHVFPPTGAQGLNLSIRDVDDLASVVADAMAHGSDLGSDAVLSRFRLRRGGDVLLRTLGSDLMTRSLTSVLPVLPAMKFLSLSVLARVPPLRAEMIRQGLGRSSLSPPLA